MRLISLRLRQWRSYEDCTIDVPDGLIGVRGPNGAGKSTIAEAIGWALFGKLRHRAKVGDLRRQGAPKGAKSSVELEFQLGSSSYRVERFVGGDARLWINGQLETEKTRDTNARIAQELDLTWEVFQRTVFAQQKDVAALDPSATSDQRKSHVERLLGLERFKNAAARARSEAKTRSSELDGLRQLAPDPTDIESLLKQAETKAAEGDPAVAAARGAHEEATRLRNEARAALEAEEERANRFTLVGQQRRDKQDAVTEAKENLTRIGERLEERKTQAERLQAIQPEAATLRTVEAALSKWDELAEAASELGDTETQLDALAYDDAKATADETQLSTLNEERTQLIERRPADASAVERASARLSALQAAEKAGVPEKRKVAVTESEAGLQDVREQLGMARRELEHDRAHVGEVEAGGRDTPCPTCGKPYGEEYEGILTGYRTRIAENEKQIPTLEEACVRLERALEKDRAALAAAVKASERVAETAGADDPDGAASEVATAQASLKHIDERLAELAEQMPLLEQQCSGREQARVQWQELEATKKAHTARVERAVKALSVDAYDVEAHAKARFEHDRIALLDAEAQELKEQLADVPHLERESQKISDWLEKAEAKLRETEEALAALAFDPDALETLKTRVHGSEARRDEAQGQLTAAQLEAQSRSQEVRDLRTRLEEAIAAHTTIAAKVTELREHEVAAVLLSKYRDAQARRAWPLLEQVASALLNAATDGRYADVKLSNDYRLSVVDRGEEHELSRFSGGEQDLANLCLRLAIADWVSKERNVDLGFVILDEVFGSQDEERRQSLLNELRALSNRFRQMLVITHLPEIAELCDEQLEVTLAEPGRSLASLA